MGNLADRQAPESIAGSRLSLLALFAATLIMLSIIWPRYAQIPGLGISPFYILGLVGWVLFASLLLFHKRYGQQLMSAAAGNALPIALFVAWLLWRLISSALGDIPSYSIGESLRDIVYLGPLLPAALILSTQPHATRTLLRIVIVATAVALVIAFLEQQTGRTVGQIFNMGVSGTSQFQAEMLRPSYRGGGLRSKSVFYHPIVFAQYLAWVLPLLVCSLGEKIGAAYKFVAMVCLVVVWVALAWTDARSGLVGAIAALGIYVALIMVQRARLGIGAGILVLTFSGLVLFMLAGFAQDMIQDITLGRDSTEFGSTQVRLLMLEIGLNNIQASPLWGFGDGRAASFVGNFTGSGPFATIDNFYLSTLLNNGWIGLLIMLAAWGMLMLSSIKAAIALRHPIDAALAAGIISLAITFSIVSLTDSISLLLISLGSLAISRTMPADTEAKADKARERRATMAAELPAA